MVIITPRILKIIFISAIFIAILALNNKHNLSNINLNGVMNIVKNMTVIILKKIEKWINFLLSLLHEKIVNKGSKLVPMLAPKTKGMA